MPPRARSASSWRRRVSRLFLRAAPAARATTQRLATLVPGRAQRPPVARAPPPPSPACDERPPSPTVRTPGPAPGRARCHLLADPQVPPTWRVTATLAREQAEASDAGGRCSAATSSANTTSRPRARAELLDDAGMAEMAREEDADAAPTWHRAPSGELQAALLPRDPDDERNVFLEIRAGTGGDESALFAGDLARMYLRYGERRGWRTEVISESATDLGGYKELVLRIEGDARLRAPEVRVRRPPGAARAGHRSARPHPHQRLHRRGAARARRGRGELSSTRPSCASTPSAPAAPAASTSTRPTAPSASPTCPPASSPSARTTARSTATRPRPWRCWLARLRDKERTERAAQGSRHAQGPDRQRRPQRPHPHLQLPAGPADRSPHQPDAVQAAAIWTATWTT